MLRTKPKLITITFLLTGLFVAISIANAHETVPPEALADADGHFIDIDGDELYYVERGLANGQPVLLLHGFGGSTVSWHSTLDALAEAGYRAIAYDRPPFGLSTKEPTMMLTNANYAAQLGKFMDALSIENAILMGHSAGGGVIAQFATEQPNRVTALVFVAGAVNIEGESLFINDAQDAQFGGFLDFASNIDPDSFVATQLIRTFLTPERFTGILESAAYNPERISAESREGYARVLQVDGWESGFLALLGQSDPTADPLTLQQLNQMTMPTLLIWGTEDTWIPLSLGEQLHSLLPNSTLVTYDEIGHVPMDETPALFNSDILRFFGELPQS